MPAPPSGISQVLNDILSADKTRRDAASEWIESQQLVVVIPLLVDALGQVEDTYLKSLAAVLMRKKLQTLENDYQMPSSSFVQSISKRLVEEFRKESDEGIRRKLADVIAAVAGLLYVSPGGWGDLWSVLNFELKEENCKVGLTLLSRLCEYPKCLEVIRRHTGDVIKSLRAYLASGCSASVNRHAVEAFVNIIDAMRRAGLKRDELQVSMRGLAPALLECASKLCSFSTGGNSSCDDVENARGVLEELTSASEIDKRLWSACLPELLHFAISLASDTSKDFELRRTAVQLVVSSLSNAPIKWLSTNTPVIDDVVRCIASWMLEVPENDEQWANQRDDGEEGAGGERNSCTGPCDDMSAVAIDALGRLLRSTESVMSSSVVRELRTTVGSPAVSSTSNQTPAVKANLAVCWQKKFASLLLLHCLIAECGQGIRDLIRDFDKFIFEQLQHSHMKVRWAALGVLCMIFEEYSPVPQQEDTVRFLRSILESIRGETVLRCKCRSLVTLCHFLEPLDEDDAEKITPFVEDILNYGILPCVRSENESLLEFSIAAAAQLTSVVGTSFSPYYSDFMQLSIRLLESGMTNERRRLCEVAVDLIGRLCPAVGLEIFRGDVPVLVNLLAEVQRHAVSPKGFLDSDTFSATLMMTLKNLAEAMEDEFSPFVPYLIEPILEAASCDTNLEVESKEGESCTEKGGGMALYQHGQKVTVEEGDQGVTKLVVGRAAAGEQCVITINSACVSFKILALSALGTFAVSAPTGFEPYAEKAYRIYQKELGSDFNLIRKSSFEAIPKLIESLWKVSQFDRCGSFLEEIYPRVLAFLTLQNTTQVGDFVLPSLESLMEIFGRLNTLNPSSSHCITFLDSSFTAMGKLLVTTLSKDIEKLATGPERDTNGDRDDEWEDKDEDEENDPEGTVYDGIMQCSSVLFKYFRELCIPFFDTHLGTGYSALLTMPNANKSGRVAAICIFGFCINATGAVQSGIANPAVYLPVVFHYAEHFLQSRELTDEDIQSAQASCFGIGVVSEKSPEVFEPHIKRAVDILQSILKHPTSQDEDNRVVIDCAACALLKVYVRHQHNPFLGVECCRASIASLLEMYYPLQEDKEDAQAAHDLLFTLIEEDSPLLPLSQSAFLVSEVRRILAMVARDPSLVSEQSRKSNRVNCLIQSVSDKESRG